MTTFTTYTPHIVLSLLAATATATATTALLPTPYTRYPIAMIERQTIVVAAEWDVMGEKGLRYAEGCGDRE